MTMVICIIVVIYASAKFIHFFEKNSPVITQYSVTDLTNYENPINLNELGFRAAFSFEGMWDKELKSDKRFVKIIFRRIVVHDFIRTEAILPHHLCTEEDLADFYPINSM